MEQKEITIASLTESRDVQIGYSDSDIVIVSNIQQFERATAAYVTMNTIVICTSGSLRATVNGQRSEIHAGQVGVMPSHVKASGFEASPDFKLKVMLFTDRILQNFLREKMSLWNELMYIHHLHVADVSEDGLRFYSLYYEMLAICFQATDSDNPFRVEIVQSLLRTGVLGLVGNLQRMIKDLEPQSSKSKTSVQHFQRFLDLLNSSPVKHRPIEAYAEELYITPKYLSTICKEHSGKTANEWITEFALSDISYYLKQTDFGIKQICELTGFPNPSFFGRYVKKHFGMTPKELKAK